MVRQYTIELRVDFADEGKYGSIEKAAEACAAQWLATAQLLKDHADPQIAILSDDFFRKHEEIKLFANTIEEGKALIADTETGETGVSQELIDAVKAQARK